MKKALYTLSETAKILGISRNTVARLVDTGYLGFVTVPFLKTRRISEFAIREFIKNNSCLNEPDESKLTIPANDNSFQDIFNDFKSQIERANINARTN